MLGETRPPVIPDPGGKSNFILAARRAAQAAIVETGPPVKEKPAGATAGASDQSMMGHLGGKVRKMIVGAGTVLVVLGSIHIMMNMLRSSDPPSEPPAKTPSSQTPPAATEPAAPASPGRQSSLLPQGMPVPDMPAGIALQGAPAPSELEATGTITQPSPQTAAVPAASTAAATARARARARAQCTRRRSAARRDRGRPACRRCQG